jgi:hypothetical protein
MKPGTKSSSKLGISPRTALLMNGATTRIPQGEGRDVAKGCKSALRCGSSRASHLLGSLLGTESQVAFQSPDGMAPRLVVGVGSDVTATCSDATAAFEYRSSRSWVDSGGDTLTVWASGISARSMARLTGRGAAQPGSSQRTRRRRTIRTLARGGSPAPRVHARRSQCEARTRRPTLNARVRRRCLRAGSLSPAGSPPASSPGSASRPAAATR